MNRVSMTNRLWATTILAGVAGGLWSAAMAQETEETETPVIEEADEEPITIGTIDEEDEEAL